MLKCVACGRELPQNNDNADTPVTCPSCGAPMKPVAAENGAEKSWLDATTQRVAPSAIPSNATATPSNTPAFEDVPTAIVAPSSAAAEEDKYQTATAIEQVDTEPHSGPTTPATSDPSAVPAWPLATTSATTDSETHSVDEAAALMPEQQSNAPAPSPEKQSRGGRRGLWLLVGAIVLLLALFVGGLALAQGNGQSTSAQHVPTVGAATTTSPPTVPADYIAVRDGQLLYSYAVPPNWKAQPTTIPNAEVTVYVSPTQDATFEVESFLTGNQQSGADLDSFILKNAFSSATPTTPTNEVFAGATWVQETADAKVNINGSSQTVQVVVETTTHNGHIFVIFSSIAVDSERPANSQTLQLILTTFIFLS